MKSPDPREPNTLTNADLTRRALTTPSGLPTSDTFSAAYREALERDRAAERTR